jgi:hypothetical protein
LFHRRFAENQGVGFRMGDHYLADLVVPIFQLIGQFAAHPIQFGLIPMPFPTVLLAVIPFGLHGSEFPAPVFVRAPIRDLEEFPLGIDRRHNVVDPGVKRLVQPIIEVRGELHLTIEGHKPPISPGLVVQLYLLDGAGREIREPKG